MVNPNDVFTYADPVCGERPEYILKNGKVFNIYGAIIYIQEQQEIIKKMSEQNK